MGKLVLSIVVAALLAGCGLVPRSTGPMTLGPDTYRIVAGAPGLPPESGQKQALEEAGKHCSSIGRQLLVTGTSAPQRSYGQFEVTYRCLLAGDPELQRPNLKPTPNTVIQLQ